MRVVGLVSAVSSVNDVKSPIGLVNGGQINGQIGDLTKWETSYFAIFNSAKMFRRTVVIHYATFLNKN
jgi:hypothetical protein